MNDDIIDAQIRMLRVGSEAHWKREIDERGVRRAWRDLVAEAGDPVRALRHQARTLEGAYLGDRVDPETGEPSSSVVLPRPLSKAFIGPPKRGKTTRAIIPGALQDLAGGARVLLVTPQPKTVADIYKAAEEVSDSAVTLFDLGGEIVSPKSKWVTTWDPSRLCGDPEAARAFAKTLAGEGSPVAADLGEGRGAGYWLQIPEGVTAAAAHLTAVERDVKEQSALRAGLSPEQARAASLHPGGLSGIGRVFDYLRRPAPPDPSRAGGPFEKLSRELRSELTPKQRAALQDHPGRLREMEDVVRNAAHHAAQFERPLQKLAYNRALLELQGAPVDRDIAGVEVEELDSIVENIAKRDSDPLDQLGKAVRKAIPPNEQRLLAPRPGDLELSPEQIVRAPGSLYVVSYDSTRSPGLGAGWFCDEVLKAAFRESNALTAERFMGGDEEFTGVSAWVDEGGALKYVDFDMGIKKGRQHNIAVNVSTTSAADLVAEVGEERANAILNSVPITVNFKPTPSEAAEMSDAMGNRKVEEVAHHYQSDNAGWSTNVSQREVPRVPVDRIRNLEEGEAVLTDNSVSIVRVPAFYEKDNPVSETMAFAGQQEGPGMPWDELRPDVRDRLEQKREAKALQAPANPGALRRIGEPVDDAPRTAAADPAPLGEPDPPGEIDPLRDADTDPLHDPDVATEERPPPPPEPPRLPTDL